MGLFNFLNSSNEKRTIKIHKVDSTYLTEVKLFINKYPQLVSELVGCSEEQITDLEHKLNLTLPLAYKEFLRWMGVKGGLLLRGSDVYYNYLIGSVWNDYIEEGISSPDASMKKHAIELLNEHGFEGNILLEDSVVIMSHQGTAIQYIKINEGENPPVYLFTEQGKWLEEGPSKWANSYSEHLLKTFTEEVKAWKKLGYIK